MCEGADMYPARQPVTLHTAGRVHSVTKQTVARHLVTDHTGHHWTRVEAYTDLG